MRIVKRLALGLVAVVAAYVVILLHPQPLFAHTLRRGNITLHARQPLPAQAAAMLDDALGRVQRSPLYDARREHDVFLCDTPGFYAFFTSWQRRSGGVAQTWGNGNVFIRPANLQRGRVIGASGVEKGGDRTLAYYVAHEVTHAMTADRVGRWRYRGLAAFQTEGYADYVAFARPVELDRGRADLVANTADMDPKRSGHYDRYRLLVGYLLQQRHLSVDDLLARPIDREATERDLLGR